MPRPTLASLLEDFRNWNKTQDWMLNKQRDIYGNEDPDTIALNEKLAGIGTADMGMMGSSVGGLAAMLRASHGSPHLFNKFDFSKIGTGEGAQAYGHGGYFAQGFDSPVAQQYREALSGGAKKAVNASFLDDPELWVAGQLHSGIRPSEITEGLGILGYKGNPADLIKSAESRLKDELSAGHLYNVELKWPDAAREAADPLGEHHLLDWDAPYTSQPESIQDLLKSTYESVYGNRNATRQRLMEKFAAAGKQAPIREEMSPITGQQLYDNLAAQLGSREAATEYLASGGIPGIRYLDQGSRGAGTGSRNYVMFDDRIPNIVSRNGVSLTDLLRR